MSLLGLITRRVLKCVANNIIDASVTDKKSAAALKLTVGVGISAIGIGVSILTADPIGLFDALRDHAAEGVATAGEVAGEFTLQVADHATSFQEAGTHVADAFSSVGIAHDSLLHAGDLAGDHAHLVAECGLRFGQDHVHDFCRSALEASSPTEASGHFVVLKNILTATDAPQHLLNRLNDVIANDWSKIHEVINGVIQHIEHNPTAQGMLPRFSGYEEA